MPIQQTNVPDRIGIWPLTSLVTGNLVGSGAYLLPATMAVFGTISLYGWLAASFGAVLLALVFAHLSSRVTKTGGPYVYAREAFCDTAGYYVAWGYWMLSWISNPALAVAAAGYISTLSGGLSPMEHFLIELLIMGSLTAFNLLGLRVTGRVELLITLLKVIPLLLLPCIGLFYVDWGNLLTHVNTSGKEFGAALSAASVMALWSFVGLETGTVPAGQVRDAERTVPRATILGTLIAASVYILGAIVIMGVVQPADLQASKAPYADAAHVLFGGAWGTVVALAAIFSCLGTLNGWTIVVGRIAYGAAQDGLFPAIFTRTTAHGTPYWGVLISALCTVPLLCMSLQGTLMEQFNFIIDVAVTLILLVYGVSVCAYFRLLSRDGQLNLARSLLGGGAMLFVLWALWATGVKMVSLSLIVLLLGVPMRLWMQSRRVVAVGC